MKNKGSFLQAPGGAQAPGPPLSAVLDSVIDFGTPNAHLRGFQPMMLRKRKNSLKLEPSRLVRAKKLKTIEGER